MAFGALQAVTALDEFRTLPHHKAAVRRVASLAGSLDSDSLRSEVRRVSAAFKDYRAEAAFYNGVDAL